MLTPAPDVVMLVIDEPGSPRFALRIECRRCGTVLARRIYDVRRTTPEAASKEAGADASASLAHRCRGH